MFSVINARAFGMDLGELASMCRGAVIAGPQAFRDQYVSDTAAWAVGIGSPAAADLKREAGHPPIHWIPLKLGVLAAVELRALGSLIDAGEGTPATSSIGRAIVEACSPIAWILDDSQTSDVRSRRAWLLWAIEEAQGLRTAELDAGRSGAMSGSAQRFESIERAIRHRFSESITQVPTRDPRRWSIGDVRLPSRTQMIAIAVQRWFPGADARVFYSQVSRAAHSEVLVAHALVNNRLEISGSDELGIVPTALTCWGQAWNHVLTYLGLECRIFEDWIDAMLRSVGRHDAADNRRRVLDT